MQDSDTHSLPKDQSGQQNNNRSSSGAIALDSRLSLDKSKGFEEPQVCAICYDDITEKLPTSFNCKHTNFCLSCFRHYLEAKMQAFEVLNIQCPHDGCPEILKETQIKAILEPDRYQRYEELVLKKAANRIPNQKYCPKTGCFLPFIPVPGEKFTICSCGTEVCNTCSNFWHPGKPCFEVVDEEFEQFAKDNEIKHCIVCKTAVSRVEGCLHMTCCVCDYEWCWNCGKQYDPKHICKGVWDPNIPNLNPPKPPLKTRIWDGIKVVFFGIAFVLIGPIVCIIGFLFFWPLILQKIEEAEARNRNQPMRKKKNLCSQICSSFALSIVTLPITLLVLVFLLMGLLTAIIFLPCRLISAWKRRRNQPPKVPKIPRWTQREGNNLQYTEAWRPNQGDQNAEAPANQIVPQPVIVDLDVDEDEQESFGFPKGSPNRSSPHIFKNNLDVEEGKLEKIRTKSLEIAPRQVEVFERKQLGDLRSVHNERAVSGTPHSVLEVEELPSMLWHKQEDKSIGQRQVIGSALDYVLDKPEQDEKPHEIDLESGLQA